MERRRKLNFTVEEVEVLCEQAAAQAREDLEWTIRIEMARAGLIATEAARLRQRLSALVDSRPIAAFSQRRATRPAA